MAHRLCAEQQHAAAECAGCVSLACGASADKNARIFAATMALLAVAALSLRGWTLHGLNTHIFNCIIFCCCQSAEAPSNAACGAPSTTTTAPTTTTLYLGSRPTLAPLSGNKRSTGSDSDSPGAGYTPLHILALEQTIAVLALALPTPAPPTAPTNTNNVIQLFGDEYLALGVAAGVLLAVCSIASALLLHAARIRRRGGHRDSRHRVRCTDNAALCFTSLKPRLAVQASWADDGSADVAAQRENGSVECTAEAPDISSMPYIQDPSSEGSPSAPAAEPASLE